MPAVHGAGPLALRHRAPDLGGAGDGVHLGAAAAGGGGRGPQRPSRAVRCLLKRVRVNSIKKVRVSSIKRVRVCSIKRVRVTSIKNVRVSSIKRVRVNSIKKGQG